MSASGLPRTRAEARDYIFLRGTSLSSESLALPPSGPWSGYYLYENGGPKHRMRLSLTFSRDGSIAGDGIDDIAPFKIDGVFESGSNKADWTKAYIGMHSVEYQGLYDGRTICGNWTLGIGSGGFWIWPSALEEAEGEAAAVQEPIEILV